MFVALSAGFASCSDDDNEKDFDNANLVGTWQATHTEGWYKDSQYPDKNENWNGTWKDEMENSLMPANMKFNADGTGMDIYNYDDFEWSMKGNLLAINYSISKSVIVRIVDLTENTVVVEFSFEQGVESGYEKITYNKVEEVATVNLVGKWQATHTEGWSQEAGSAKKTWNGSWDKCDLYSAMANTYVFAKEGTGIYEYDGQETSLTWSLKGNQLSITEEGEGTVVVTVTQSGDDIEVEASYNGNDYSYHEKTTYKRVK